MSNTTSCMGVQSQGRATTTCRIAKTLLCQLAGIEVQTLLPIASSYQSHQGKCSAVKHWMEQCITYTEKRQSKISSIVMSVVLACGGISQQPAQNNPPMCTPLPLRGRSPPPLCGDRYSSEVGQML